MAPFKPFLVWRSPERTRVETTDGLLGWGVQFPTGRCVVEWRLEAYPPENRLGNPHLSEYGSIDDVEQGTGGVVQDLEDVGRRPEGAV